MLGFYSVIKLPMQFDSILNQFSTMPTTRVSHNPIDHPVNKSCTFQAISSLGRRPPTKPQKLSSFSPFWRKLNICWGSLVSLWLHWRERGVEEGGGGEGGCRGVCGTEWGVELAGSSHPPPPDWPSSSSYSSLKSSEQCSDWVLNNEMGRNSFLGQVIDIDTSRIQLSHLLSNGLNIFSVEIVSS